MHTDKGESRSHRDAEDVLRLWQGEIPAISLYMGTDPRLAMRFDGLAHDFAQIAHFCLFIRGQSAS